VASLSLCLAGACSLFFGCEADTPASSWHGELTLDIGAIGLRMPTKRAFRVDGVAGDWLKEGDTLTAERCKCAALSAEVVDGWLVVSYLPAQRGPVAERVIVSRGGVGIGACELVGFAGDGLVLRSRSGQYARVMYAERDGQRKSFWVDVRAADGRSFKPGLYGELPKELKVHWTSRSDGKVWELRGEAPVELEFAVLIVADGLGCAPLTVL
jgi:hypothetical protein